MKTLAILHAAGVSRRFGATDKLLANWESGTLVGAAAATLLTAGCDFVAAVVSNDAVADALPRGYRILRIAPGQEISPSFSAACGLAEALETERMLVALGDMPSVRPKTLRLLLADGSTSRCCAIGNVRTPPAALLRADWRHAQLFAGDQGARGAIRALPSAAILPLGEDEAADIDTAADLDRMRALGKSREDRSQLDRG